MGKGLWKGLKKMHDPAGFFADEPKPPDPPTIKDPNELRTDASRAAAEELRKRRKGGRGSTILTDSLETAPTKKKTLLGQ